MLGDLLGGLVSAIGGIDAQEKQLQAQVNQASLSARDNYDLQQALMKANSSDARLKILSDTLTNIRSAQQSALITSRGAKEQSREKNTMIIILGGSALLLISVILIKKL